MPKIPTIDIDEGRDLIDSMAFFWQDDCEFWSSQAVRDMCSSHGISRSELLDALIGLLSNEPEALDIPESLAIQLFCLCRASYNQIMKYIDQARSGSLVMLPFLLELKSNPGCYRWKEGLAIGMKLGSYFIKCLIYTSSRLGVPKKFLAYFLIGARLMSLSADSRYRATLKLKSSGLGHLPIVLDLHFPSESAKLKVRDELAILEFYFDLNLETNLTPDSRMRITIN